MALDCVGNPHTDSWAEWADIYDCECRFAFGHLD